MRKSLLSLTVALLTATSAAASADMTYQPTEDNLRSRQEFADARLGIFIHWGIYSMFGQGEWYLNYGPTAKEYAKAAAGFYPIGFDANEWVDAIKDSGAGYVCFTSRHHDGFSMWHTAQSDYNIVDATPFKRDVIGELAQACHDKDLRLHLYYSHLDWTREDYPMGRTGHTTGRDSTRADWTSYRRFMDAQLTELLTNYGEIGAIWFDGWWDHKEDSVPFDWQLESQYRLIHSIQPACLVANNHHHDIFEGEDMQIFERDIPGQNTAGYSEQAISRLPLETCQTMNGMWGYKVVDQNYKSGTTLVRLLVSTAARGANLLLNVGPQPDGRLPQAALDRLAAMGRWMKKYGATVRRTEAADFEAQPWGAGTRRADSTFVHVMTADSPVIHIPTGEQITRVTRFDDGSQVSFKKHPEGGITIDMGTVPDEIDYILVLKHKKSK